MLHQNGTDRLWVRWILNSKRVRNRLTGKSNARGEALDALKLLAPLVRFDPSGKPARAGLAESLARQRVSIEIPSDILEVERVDMRVARSHPMGIRRSREGGILRGRVLSFDSRTAGPRSLSATAWNGERSRIRAVGFPET